MLARARANPDKLTYGSSGIGSSIHLSTASFSNTVGVKMVHVPFKGTPEAMTDVVGGRSDWFFAPLSSALPLIRDGKLQALAVDAFARAMPVGAICHGVLVLAGYVSTNTRWLKSGRTK